MCRPRGAVLILQRIRAVKSMSAPALAKNVLWHKGMSLLCTIDRFWSLTAAICFLVTSCFSNYVAILLLASFVAGSYSFLLLSCSRAIASASVRCCARLLLPMRWDSCWYASPADCAAIPPPASSSFALLRSLNMLQSEYAAVRASYMPRIPVFFCVHFMWRATAGTPSITCCHQYLSENVPWHGAAPAPVTR